jgi:hypothetical protein
MRSLGKSFASFLVVVFIMSLIILQPTLVSAQTSSSTSPPTIQWQKVYGGGTAAISNLIQTNDGGYAFLDCGNSYQLYPFFPSILYKLDSSGNMQWNKTINLFEASNIIQTSDGGYEIAGEWNTYGTTYQYNATLIKLNSKGDIQWYENTSTILNLAVVSSNIQTSDGGFAHFGQGSPYDFSSTMQLVKTDSNNNTQWIENLTYSGPANYYNGSITFPFKIFSLIETSDGALAGLGIADPYLTPQGFWGLIYLVKAAPFLPLPSQSPLPTPLPSPTPAPFMITVNEQILIIALIAGVVVLLTVLLIYRRHRKTANLRYRGTAK